jgi:hypothetical protein
MYPCKELAIAEIEPAVALTPPSAIIIDGTPDPTTQKMKDDSRAMLSSTSSDPFHSTPHPNDRAFPVRFYPSPSAVNADL